MTSPQSKPPLFIYSYDPPSPQRLSEYDPPYPEEVLSPYNERNYLKFEFNESKTSEEQQIKINVDGDQYEKKNFVSVFNVNKMFEKKLPDEIGYVTNSPYIKHNCSTASTDSVSQTFNSTDSTLFISSESTTQSFTEEVSFRSTEAHRCDAKLPDDDIIQSSSENTFHTIKKADCSFSTAESSSPSLIDNCSKSSCIQTSESLEDKTINCQSLLSENCKDTLNGNSDKSKLSRVDTGPLNSTSSDCARCSSPLSTTHSISSLPSDTVTINVPFDWSNSDSDLPTLDWSNDIPRTNSMSQWVNSSSFSRENSSSAATIDVTPDSAFNSSPTFSPALTDSCTITPLPTDCVTPNSTNPTSTPLPSPLPVDFLTASASESSPSTPSTVTTSDMFIVSKKLERIAESFDLGVAAFSNNNSNRNSDSSPHKMEGLVGEADSTAITAKNSTVAQLSAIFESRKTNCQNQTKSKIIHTKEIASSTIVRDNNLISAQKSSSPFGGIDTQSLSREMDSANLSSESLPNPLPKENSIHFEQIESISDKLLNNTTSDPEHRPQVKNVKNEVDAVCSISNGTFQNAKAEGSQPSISKTEENENENSSLGNNLMSRKGCAPKPPPRFTSSIAIPPPLPPPPVEECIEELAPPVPNLPSNFCFTSSESRSRSPPLPPLRQYLLIPLTPGRKTPMLFSPPYIPPRSVSFSRTTSPFSSKPQTPTSENKFCLDHFFFKNGLQENSSYRDDHSGNFTLKNGDIDHSAAQNNFPESNPYMCNNNNAYQNVMEGIEPHSKEFAHCPKIDNGFVQILTPVPEERISPRGLSLSPASKLSEGENNSTSPDFISGNSGNVEEMGSNIVEAGLKLNEEITEKNDDTEFTSDNPPPLPPPPEDQADLHPPPLPPKPNVLRISAISSPKPPTPPPKRPKSHSSTPIPKIIFSTPEPPFSDRCPIENSSPTTCQDTAMSTVPDSVVSSPSVNQTSEPNSTTTPVAPTPPALPISPPTPPSNPIAGKCPLISVSPYGKLVINRSDLPLPLPEEEIRKAFTNAKAYGWITPERDTLALYTQVRPIIQQGPQCGLVALSMASQLCPSTVSVETLLTKAKEKAFSTHGEMFSAESMKLLADEVVEGIQASVRTDILRSATALFRTLMEGDLILVPYDADHNHQPGLHQGRKAHWGLICGCLLQSSCLELHQETTVAKLDIRMDNLWHFRPRRGSKRDLSSDRPSSVPPGYSHGLHEENKRFARSVSPSTCTNDITAIAPSSGADWSSNISNLVVLWRQGKSRNLILSPIEELRRSNEQLTEYPEINDYIIDNVVRDLSGQVVVLHKVKQGLSDLLGTLQQDLIL